MPGLEIGLFKFDGMIAGAAICKDLDFQEYIKKYGKSKVVFLCIPAWDFVIDDWLHSRMAILRGIENGFSEVRTARQGRLTISDPYGRINAEATCANGKATTLIGQLSLKNVNTYYTRFGDWFGISILFVAILIILKTAIERHKQ
jgi:apolipoprotein N-acyltransferase